MNLTRDKLKHMAILDYSADIWREALGFPKGEEPDALILEGTWWRQNATRTRMSHLSEVKELAFPDMFVGQWGEAKIAYCCAYGAARAVEPAHIFAQLGAPLLIQIGTCGSLDMELKTGVVVLPENCAARDGISQIYGAANNVRTSDDWVSKAESALQKRNVASMRTRHLTWPSLFAQSNDMCDEWEKEGIKSIDMETSTVIGVAEFFGVSSVSLLSVWDALQHERTFLDPLEDDAAAALTRANEAVFEVALELAVESHSLRHGAVQE